MDDQKSQIAVLIDQGKWVAKKFDSIESKIESIEVKIDNLNAFKFKVIGAVALAITIIEIARARS